MNLNCANFIKELKHHLRKLPQSEIDEIINDQEEFIREAVAQGKSEEEILKSFGSSKEMADTLIAENKFGKIKEAESFSSLLKAILGSFGAIVILAPINFLILLGPVLAGFCVLVTLLSLGAGFFFAGFGGLFYYLSTVLTMALGAAAHITSVSLLLGFIGLGMMFLFITYFVTYACGQAFVAYFNWNLNFIKRNS